MTLPVETRSTTRPPRRARIAQAAKNSAVCSSCGRQKARMGTLLPADATRDKRSMLITQVAALEGWCRCQSLDIWRQTPCKDLLGRQPGHAAELQRHTRSLVLPDSQRTYKKRPIRPKETTRRVRHAATPSPSVPRAAQRRRLQDGCPWRRPPCHDWQHPRPCAHASRSRAQFTGVHHGAAPVRVSVSSSPPLPEIRLRILLYMPISPS